MCDQIVKKTDYVCDIQCHLYVLYRYDTELFPMMIHDDQLDLTDVTRLFGDVRITH